MRVTGLDHIVLFVADAERSLAFYRDLLGLGTERYDEWRTGDAPFVSVRIGEGTIIDLLEREPDGKNMDHICLTVVETDLEVLVDDHAFDVVEGPVHRWGARGMARSVYVRDPDGHVVELRVYPD